MTAPAASLVHFKNGHEARLVIESPGQAPADLVRALGLTPPRAVIIVSGGAAELDPAVRAGLTKLFARGVVRAAMDTGALLVDGGTQAGVMELLGEAVADRGRDVALLGVAPSGKVWHPEGDAAPAADRVALESHHSHFVLADAQEWGAERTTMYEVAAAIADGAPVLTLVAGGGSNSLHEVLASVRRRWPVILLEGTGGIADQLIARRGDAPAADDAVTAEILADGNLESFPLTGAPEALARRIAQELGHDVTLRLAWERFAALDAAATTHQRGFGRLQAIVLGLGVLATVLALVKKTLETSGPVPAAGTRAMSLALIVLPILVSIGVAAGNRFKLGNKWLLVRAAAEAVKREIFYYRVRAGAYRDPVTREPVLAQRVEDVTRRLARTEANTAALRPHTGPLPPPDAVAAGDEGLKPLTPDRYVETRLLDQLGYYRRRTLKLERQLDRLQWLILILGGAGTLLAAIGLELWLALTTTLVTTITTYLGQRQVESTLMNYNQTATDLDNVRGWWSALSPDEQTLPTNVDKLVDHVEKLLDAERGGWVQKMQDALAELRKDDDDKKRPA